VLDVGALYVVTVKCSELQCDSVTWCVCRQRQATSVWAARAGCAQGDERPRLRDGRRWWHLGCSRANGSQEVVRSTAARQTESSQRGQKVLLVGWVHATLCHDSSHTVPWMCDEPRALYVRHSQPLNYSCPWVYDIRSPWHCHFTIVQRLSGDARKYKDSGWFTLVGSVLPWVL